MADGLKQFMGNILSIIPRYNDVLTNGIPGTGMANMDADVIGTLRIAATRFAQTYVTPTADQSLVRQLADDTEGALMAAVTVGAVEVARVDPLIDDLHRLVDEKFSKEEII